MAILKRAWEACTVVDPYIAVGVWANVGAKHPHPPIHDCAPHRKVLNGNRCGRGVDTVNRSCPLNRNVSPIACPLIFCYSHRHNTLRKGVPQVSNLVVAVKRLRIMPLSAHAIGRNHVAKLMHRLATTTIHSHFPVPEGCFSDASAHILRLITDIERAASGKLRSVLPIGAQHQTLACRNEGGQRGGCHAHGKTVLFLAVGISGDHWFRFLTLPYSNFNYAQPSSKRERRAVGDPWRCVGLWRKTVRLVSERHLSACRQRGGPQYISLHRLCVHAPVGIAYSLISEHRGESRILAPNRHAWNGASVARLSVIVSPVVDGKP